MGAPCRALASLLGLCAALAARGASADSEPVTIRMATMAPVGTAWAREFNAFARDVQQQTNGAVRIKWYFGGIVGNEPTMGARMARGQIDAVASGGPLCETYAPSMRVMRVVGLLTNAAEASFVNHHLWPIFEREFRHSGVMPLQTAPIGPHILFTRRPVRSMAELRKTRLWVWDKDDVLRAELSKLQLPIVPAPLEQAAQIYEDGRVDGFISPASAALAFQWSTRAHYVTDLRLDYFFGCVLISERAFDPLPPATQALIRAAGAKLGARFADVSQRQDAELLGGLFARQGVHPVPPSPGFAAELFELARAARDSIDEKLVPRALIMNVLASLADYRAQR